MFTHLHVHTSYSLLDGLPTPKALAKKAKELGQTALAITDHGYMYGVVDFYNACVAEGIKPIIGIELYTVKDIYEKTKETKKTGHIILLAKDETGYKNLVKLASIAAVDGLYYRPRTDLKTMAQHHEGIVCLSGCIQGDVQQLLLQDKYEEAKALALEYKEIFGEDYYLELQYHGLPEQKQILPNQLKLAEETGIQLVATNDAHYLNRSDAFAQRTLMCMSMNKTVDDETAIGYGNPDEWYLKSEEEMNAIFGKIAPAALENTNVIADKCNLVIEQGNYHLPAYPLSEKWSSNKEFFATLCNAGLKKRYGKKANEHRAQLEHEMEVIEKMGFIDYFLIVFDIISFAKQNNIPIGPGRGSAAGSIVSYCLGITELEPTQYGLLFERFLNPERVTMPDIDIDIDPDGREDVINYIASRYGDDHVSQIVTYGTLAAKSAVRDVGKALSMDQKDITDVSRLIPSTPGITIREAIEANPQLRQKYEQDASVKRLLDVAASVEGSRRHTGTHAAGVIIAPKDLTEYIPVKKSSETNRLVSQFDMGSVEAVGMLKVDLLGLKTLTVLKNAEELAREKSPNLNLERLKMADPAVYAMLANGDTSGVFQFESDGMRDVLRKMKPSCFEDLIAAIALYRPGPMDSIPDFIKNKHHPENIKYLHPKLEPILKDTYGIIVYQEQVMAIVRELAGYSYGRSDLVRRAMAKKKPEKLAVEKEIFINGKDRPDGTMEVPGCLYNGISEDVALQLWDLMEKFAAYAFNKSHAAAYAKVAYQTAYMRCHFPLEFMASLMTNAIGETDKLLRFINDCSKQGIKILPPDVNVSEAGFTVEGDAIRFGLAAIKQTGKAVLAELVMERANGPFTDLQNLVERTITSCNSKTMDALIKSGALDSFPHSREQMLAVLPKMLKAAAKARKEMIAEQVSIEDAFFTDGNEPQKKFHFDPIEIPTDVEPISRKELLKWEQESTGMYVSGHPMSEYKAQVEGKISHKLYQLIPQKDESGAIIKKAAVGDGDLVRVAGVITQIRKTTTKKKANMAFVTIEDETGKMDVTVFPKTFDSYAPQLMEGIPVIVYGRMEENESFGNKVVAQSLAFIAQAEEAPATT